MTAETWYLYVITILLFMSTPGPSYLLMISVSMENGFQRSLATAAGDLTANTVQIVLAGFGLAAVITTSSYGFTVVKWAGVFYLAWIGIRTLIDTLGNRASTKAAPRTTLRELWLRGFITSAANPKAVVFFAALFPQFIHTDSALPPQIAILGLTYIVIDGTILVFYGRGASWVGQKIGSQLRVWVDRLAGLSLIAAAILLGLRSNSR